jgi:hypothetical protein
MFSLCRFSREFSLVSDKVYPVNRDKGNNDV